jgi:FixJ family two-component response regulator
MSISLPAAQATATVAVVDDDENVRLGMGNLIRAIGFAPELFDGGPAFLKQDIARFACVLSDMQMPGMSGLELQRELAVRAPDLPIVFITGYPDEAIKEAAFAAGAKGFFEKPCDIDELIAVIEGIAGPADV